MKCSEIEERLTAYLEDFPQNEEREIIEQHCAQCSRCRSTLEDLKRTREILENLDEVEPPSWLAGKVMAKITEKEEDKGWLQRFFLPFHVKVPVQALAMALVVVMSVYLYRSTTPEPGDLARLQSPPQAAGSLDAPAKREADTKKKSERAPRADRQGTERKKGEVLKAPEKPMPDVLAEKDSISGHALTKEAPTRAAVVPPMEKAERFKTRGMAGSAAREENISQYKMAARGGVRGTPWQIIVTSADPSDVVHKARSIMISLSVKEVRERTENSSVIISGLIDPKRVSELKSRMAEIATVHEVRTGSGEASPGPVEIIVLKGPASP